MDVLRTDHSAVNGVEWYAQTRERCVTDSMCRATVRDVTEAIHHCHDTICLSPVKWCTELNAIDHVGPSYPPAFNGYISAL
ncbi:hypothetical protein TNCV_5058151 [Trichonephila clavipes]|nr:hypothetical protein TNCV_5058151 [Trichonephila clavipes]